MFTKEYSMIFYSTEIVILEKPSTFCKVLKFLEPSTMLFDLELILDCSGEFFSFQKILESEKLLFSIFSTILENSEVQSKQYVYFKHIGHPVT